MTWLTRKRVGAIGLLLSFLLVVGAIACVYVKVADVSVIWAAGAIHGLHIAAYYGLRIKANKEGVELGDDNKST